MDKEHSESREDYLESILILKNKNGAVRSIDIAEYFNYSRPSVSRAMGILRSDGMITMEKSGFIELTDDGLVRARAVYQRHKTLISFLELLGVGEPASVRDACRLEHILSQESMDCIDKFVNNNSSKKEAI